MFDRTGLDIAQGKFELQAVPLYFYDYVTPCIKKIKSQEFYLLLSLILFSFTTYLIHAFLFSFCFLCTDCLNRPPSSLQSLEAAYTHPPPPNPLLSNPPSPPPCQCLSVNFPRVFIQFIPLLCPNAPHFTKSD